MAEIHVNVDREEKSRECSPVSTLNIGQRMSPMTRSPRRGKGRATAKFNSLRNNNWNPEPRIFQSSSKKYQYHGRRTQEKFKYESLAQFKMAPCVLAESKPRPFMGSCCNKCFPISKAAAVDQRVFCLSVYNILNIPFFQKFEFSHIFNLFKKYQKPLYPCVHANNIHSDRFLNAINKDFKSASEGNDEIKEGSYDEFQKSQINRAKEVLDSLRVSISTVLLQFSSFTFQNILRKVFDGILIHKGQIEILKTASQEDVPIIYLPRCHSLLDYFLVMFILHMNSLKVPLLVFETDFYIPVLGYLLRFLGVLFINQASKFDKKDHLYPAVLENYFSECLKAGHNIEMCIDDFHYQSKNKRIANANLLRVAIKLVSDEILEDVYVSIIAISYEKNIRGNYIEGQLGNPNQKRNIFTNIYTFWKMMHLNLGNIRFNFGQPFSIKELLQNSEQKSSFKSSNLELSSSDESSSEIISHWSKRQLKSVMHDLTQHIMYDVTSSTSLMSTQLVAFLFITQYRKGATQQQLQSSLDWLRAELLIRLQDVGFTGESPLVIRRAVDLLGKQLIVTETVDMEWTSKDLENNNIKVTVYKPVIQLPHVLELHCYASSVIPVFFLDSLIANSLYALVDVEICHFRHCDSKLFVLRDKLIDKAIELCEILQYEFVANPPCVDIVVSLSNALDALIAKECLHCLREGSGLETLYNRKRHDLCFESDEEDNTVTNDQQLKIDLAEESINHLEFLRNILSPFIESYWLAACTLLHLVDDIKEENVLIQEMQLIAQEKLYKGLLTYEESFFADTFMNAMKLFKKWHVLEEHFQDGIKIICLNDDYNSIIQLNDIVARIEEFKK